MRIAFIETSGLTNELLRAVAGAAPNCVGYPDGVPESWRDGPADVSAVKRVPEKTGKHPICETRGEWPRLPSGKPTHRRGCRWWDAPRPGEVFRPCSCGFLVGGAGGGAVEPNNSVLLGLLRDRAVRLGFDAGRHAPVVDVTAPGELDPAALLGPVAEPVDWRSMTYADLQPGDAVQFAGDMLRAYVASRADWPDERGDDEC